MSDILYHVTTHDDASDILRRGLGVNSCLSTATVARHHVHSLRARGQRPAVMEVSAHFAMRHCRPDGLALVSPGDNGLKSGEDEIFSSWARSGGTASDCLALVGSVRSREPIPAGMLRRCKLASELSVEESRDLSASTAWRCLRNIVPDVFHHA